MTQLLAVISQERCYKDWYDLSRNGGVRKLQRDDVCPSPFKQTVSPFRLLSSFGSDPKAIRNDPAHTYAIAGWGKDLCAGGLILLIRIGVFGGTTLVRSFQTAFEHFKEYCKRFGKTTSITEFSLKALKVQSCLGRLVAIHVGTYARGVYSSITCKYSRMCGTQVEAIPQWLWKRARLCCHAWLDGIPALWYR